MNLLMTQIFWEYFVSPGDMLYLFHHARSWTETLEDMWLMIYISIYAIFIECLQKWSEVYRIPTVSISFLVHAGFWAFSVLFHNHFRIHCFHANFRLANNLTVVQKYPNTFFVWWTCSVRVLQCVKCAAFFISWHTAEFIGFFVLI